MVEESVEMAGSLGLLLRSWRSFFSRRPGETSVFLSGNSAGEIGPDLKLDTVCVWKFGIGALYTFSSVRKSAALVGATVSTQDLHSLLYHGEFTT